MDGVRACVRASPGPPRSVLGTRDAIDGAMARFESDQQKVTPVHRTQVEREPSAALPSDADVSHS